MKFLVLVYNDPALLGAMPKPQFDETMRGCLEHADDLRERGTLLDTQMLQAPSTAKTIRVRRGRQTVTDGPFTETKEVLGGFNLIEAADMDEAVRIASEFPWTGTGSIEVRPILDVAVVREQVALQ